MALALGGFALRMTAVVANRGDVPMPFSFGFHPAFAWPLPGGTGKEAHRLVFAWEEAQPGARYLCIEPWRGIADPMDYEGDFRDEPGVAIPPPGEERSFRMDVTVSPG